MRYYILSTVKRYLAELEWEYYSLIQSISTISLCSMHYFGPWMHRNVDLAQIKHLDNGMEKTEERRQGCCQVIKYSYGSLQMQKLVSKILFQ